MYKRCTDCEKRGKISEKKKNKQKPNSLIFIQVNSNSFIVIYHIKDFGNLYTINRIGAFFVVRAKTNVRFKPVAWKRRLPPNVISDAIGYFTVYKSAKDYPEKLRKVVCVDPEDGTRYIFLTNNLTASAETIAELYRNRWSVELFFKWINRYRRMMRPR